MPFTEALFWIGITVVGTGLYILWDRHLRSLPGSIALIVAGAIAVAYSVYLHSHPNAPNPPVWIVLVAVTWLAIGWSVYDRHRFHRPVSPQHLTTGENAGLVQEPIRARTSDPTQEIAIAPPKQMTAALAEPSHQPPLSLNINDKTVVDVTPEYLISFFKDHVNVQAQRLLEPYIGQRMVVRDAEVIQVSESFPGRLMVSTNAHVDLRFKEDWRPRVLVLRKGSRITAIGEIKGVSFGSVDLENCELAS
jgi:hypothetical protein